MSPIPDAQSSAIVSALEPSASELRSLGRFPSVEEIDRVVSPRAGVRFESSPPKGRRDRKKPRAPIDPTSLYDGRITVSGAVPTRPGSAHDLWNALVWSAFPRSKRALHARQHRLICERLDPAALSLPKARTREQDTVAMIDEGGILLVAAPGQTAAIERALETRTVGALLDLRPSLAAICFGHAIHEQLAVSSARVLGFAVILETELPAPHRTVEIADQLLAGMLAEAGRFLSPAGHRGVSVEPALFVEST